MAQCLDSLRLLLRLLLQVLLCRRRSAFTDIEGSVVLLIVLAGCRMTAETNAAEAWFNIALRHSHPRKPQSSLGRTAQDANSKHWFTSFLQPLPYLVTPVS